MILLKEVTPIKFEIKYDRNTHSYIVPRTLSDICIFQDPESIYAGKISDFEDCIKSKLNKNNPSTFKKVYFDCRCKYPRYKLSEYTDIKRCLNPSKADSCIITKEVYRCFDMMNIIYSASDDKYYSFKGAIRPYMSYNNTIRQAVQYILNKFNYKFDSNDTLRVLKESKVIPPDSILYYSGSCMSLDGNLYEHFDNIINKFMQITYDTELDKFVSINNTILSADDLNTIDGMLGSSDAAVVAMGMKLLSSYNISNSICAVTAVVSKNISNIRQNSARTSVGFKQILQQLNISSLHDNAAEMINSAYCIATNQSDKDNAHKVVCDSIKNELELQFNHIIRKYHNMKFNIDININ